jgi:hypothetical protein
MPLFSAFTKFGNGFTFSSTPSHGERIYRNMISSIGVQSLSTEEGTRMRAWCYAGAMMAARVRYTLEHAGYQLDPLKVTEMLPLREAEYGIVPGPHDSIDDRRAVLAARILAQKGGDFNNIKNALLALLGDSFVQYIPTAYADAVVYPANIGDQPMNLVTPDRLPKLLTIVPTISLGLGAPQWVQYEPVDLSPSVPDADAQPTDVFVGETFTVEPGHNLLQERIEVLDVRELVPGFLELQATFNNPHSAGTLATNMPYPYWLSTKRFNLAVLESSAAADAETRRKTNELLARMVRVVSTWDICQEDPLNPGFTGTFKVGVGPLGYQTIGSVTIPL